MASRHSNQGALSALDDAPVWLNSEPLTAEGLRGRVVLVDIWTYSCVNWLRTLPYVRAWAERYRDRGLLIVAVPSNDFGSQEPGGASEIHATASHVYGITFPLAEKAVVKGASPHPFYKWAASERPLDVPRWNFHKYLIGRDGHIAAAFPSAVEPTDPRLIAAIEKQLE